MQSIKAGDTMTIAGVFRQIPNPNRAWWQLWRPKFIQSEVLQTFNVTASATAPRS